MFEEILLQNIPIFFKHVIPIGAFLAPIWVIINLVFAVVSYNPLEDQ